MGIDNAQMEKTKVTFLGQEHTAIHTSASIQDLPYYILQLFCYNLGGQYYVTITLATFWALFPLSAQCAPVILISIGGFPNLYSFLIPNF